MVAIVVVDVNPTPKARKHITECVQLGRCLCCGESMLKRGLCYRCYYRWRRERDRLPSKQKKVEYDSKLIRTGRLLDQQAVREYRARSVFSAAAEEVK